MTVKQRRRLRKGQAALAFILRAFDRIEFDLHRTLAFRGMYVNDA